MADATLKRAQDSQAAVLHPRTADLVDRFAEALKAKLARAQVKYGYADAWANPDWMDTCRADLVRHVDKGDPLDVAAYCAFLWHHGEPTNFLRRPPSAQGRYDVEALRDCANRACAAAFGDARTKEEPINFGDLCCVVAEHYSDERGADGYRVVIEEADPSCTGLRAVIADHLMAAGYIGVEVVIQW